MSGTVEMKFESYFENQSCVGWWKLYHPNLISGWLIDKQNRQHKAISIQVDGHSSDKVEANEYKEHLVGKEGSDGYNGFRYRIPDEAMGTDEIHVELLDLASGKVLDEARFDLNILREADKERMIFPPGDTATYKGWVGNIDGGRVSGWIIENQGVHAPSSIRISVGNYVSEEIIRERTQGAPEEPQCWRWEFRLFCERAKRFCNCGQSQNPCSFGGFSANGRRG